MRPAATDDPDFGARWRAALKGERAEATHRTLAGGTACAATVALPQAMEEATTAGRAVRVADLLERHGLSELTG